jgi:hypothetical protein
MYLRWKKRAGQRGQALQWQALLVESRRVDGRPKQFVVQYLGSIVEDDYGAGAIGRAVRRIQFWARVAPRLVQLVEKGILDSDRVRLVVSKLESVVPPYDAGHDPYVGHCGICHADRHRSECREVRSPGYPLSLAVWICATCGATLDDLPF